MHSLRFPNSGIRVKGRLAAAKAAEATASKRRLPVARPQGVAASDQPTRASQQRPTHKGLSPAASPVANKGDAPPVRVSAHWQGDCRPQGAVAASAGAVTTT
ncbi:hypothetical protein B296_00045964 [Ensete ventricosum]|uniref:Uncharacterized protein n=1 Tax=Ensete ventricosum TaxID=4639 RepID=A0A426X5F1_ENSVE|nr:hypothetical protein B296_00045964 [Ensete ventricosum]